MDAATTVIPARESAGLSLKLPYAAGYLVVSLGAGRGVSFRKSFCEEWA